MRKILIILVVFLSAVSYATASQGSFRGIKWGENISEYRNLIFVERHKNGVTVYRRNGDVLKIADTPVTAILYMFRDNIFFSLKVEYNNQRPEVVAEALRMESSKPNVVIAEGYVYLIVDDLPVSTKVSRVIIPKEKTPIVESEADLDMSDYDAPAAKRGVSAANSEDSVAKGDDSGISDDDVTEISSTPAVTEETASAKVASSAPAATPAVSRAKVAPAPHTHVAPRKKNTAPRTNTASLAPKKLDISKATLSVTINGKRQSLAQGSVLRVQTGSRIKIHGLYTNNKNTGCKVNFKGWVAKGLKNNNGDDRNYNITLLPNQLRKKYAVDDESRIYPIIAEVNGKEITLLHVEITD